jgi:hypothetical protein
VNDPAVGAQVDTVLRCWLVRFTADSMFGNWLACLGRTGKLADFVR